MKIFIGSDHGGFNLRQDLMKYLKDSGRNVVDQGDEVLNPEDDFPQFAAKVANAVLSSDDPDVRGILICRNGQGVCIAANRFKGIRAALGYSRVAAQSTRNDDDSNVLCLPADVINKDEAFEIVDLWLNTPFAAAPRFIRRNKELDNL